MTYEEALEILEDMNTTWSEDGDEAICVAIRALEKQIPRKPLNKRYGEHDIITGLCPVCFSLIGNVSAKAGCRECLQAIDWSEEE